MYYSLQLTSRIIDTTRGNSIPFEYLPLPVFFLLYAKKTGKLSKLDNERLAFIYDGENESDELLLGLYGKFMNAKNTDINGKHAYRSLISFLNSYDDIEFKNYYSNIIDSLLLYLAAHKHRNSAIFAQPDSITRLVGEIVKKLNPKSIYNPFAGLGSYALVSDCDYYGQELNYDTLLLAQLRLDAHNKNIKSVKFEDSMMLWDSITSDCLLSTPPFGITFRGEYKNIVCNSLGKNCHTIEEFVLYNFINSPMRSAVLIFPASITFSIGMESLRKTIVENNILDMVIELPSGIFYDTAIKTVVLVLKKSRNSDKITFVDGQECIIDDNKIRDLDVDSLKNILDNGNTSKITVVDKEDVVDNEYSWSAIDYISYAENAGKSQINVPLCEIIELGVKIDTNEDTGIVLESSDFYSDVNVLFSESRPEYKQIMRSFMKGYIGEHIVMSAMGSKITFCKCNFDEPFYITPNQVAFSLKKDTDISLEYLLYALVNSKSIQRLYSHFGMNTYITRRHIKQILKCSILIHSDLEDRCNVIKSIKEEYIRGKRESIQTEMQRLGIRDASSDLSHVLGASFHKISTAIDFIQSEELSNDAKQTLNSIRDNFAYMKRMITTVGADFETQRLNLQEVEVNSFIKSYTESWNNLGYSVFELSYHSDISDSVSIKIDEDMFRVIFDTVLRNAYKHGFGAQRSSDNKVYIETSLVTYNDKEYVLLGIANNGTPFPKELTIEKYIKRGGFAGVTGNTGLGGYHVYSIVKRHNGFLNISSSQAWGAIVEMLVPVEFYEETDTDKFEEYGNTETCI